jgi:RNA polymerase sigma factor (sigma-70 family)
MPGMNSSDQNAEPVRQKAAFATTRWSLVLAAGERDNSTSPEALAELCQSYWYPLYAYVRRRIGDVHEAQDLTQAFFQQFLEKHAISAADPNRGRFRAFLLTACKRFLINEWHKDRAEKRGGFRKRLSLDFDLGESKYALEAIETENPERLYEQQWAITLLARVLEKLRTEFEAKQKPAHFEQLKQFLSGSKKTEAYAQAALELGISAGALKVAAHRLRTRYRELLRFEIAQTVENPNEVDDEIKSLFAILGSK